MRFYGEVTFKRRSSPWQRLSSSIWLRSSTTADATILSVSIGGPMASVVQIVQAQTSFVMDATILNVIDNGIFAKTVASGLMILAALYWQDIISLFVFGCYACISWG
ncbi:hypothetical protein CCP2SC5_540004 [Azospirillaceae bacterium]